MTGNLVHFGTEAAILSFKNKWYVYLTSKLLLLSSQFLSSSLLSISPLSPSSLISSLSPSLVSSLSPSLVSSLTYSSIIHSSVLF